MYRVAVVGGILAFSYWVYTQPTELDELIGIQKKFVEDLYAGNLLSDESHKTENDIDRVIPNLEEIERQLREDENEVEQTMDKMMQDDEVDVK